MTYFFYILRCADGSLYSGITNNLKKRIKEHNFSNSKFSKYTRSRRPVRLVFSEKYSDKPSALKREIEVKKWKRVKKEALIKSHSLTNK